MTDRIFGTREAEAMFNVIHSHLSVDTAREVANELQNERELLLESRRALSQLMSAVRSENFNRTGRREISTNLRAAMKAAEAALDDGAAISHSQVNK